jgi:transketolase
MAESDQLRHIASAMRLNILRTHARAGCGHLGSALSIVEILTVLFHRHIRWPDASDAPTRGDRFILSKGHAALALYCALESVGRIAESQTATFARNGSALEPHPNENLLPEIHASTGSLGQGLSIGVGFALGSQLLQTADRVFVIIGDGETNEGQIWEAARSAASLKLQNLVVVLDNNGMQQDGPNAEIMDTTDVAACWKNIGWQTAVCDGHDCQAIDRELTSLLSSEVNAPILLTARTVKGRGVTFLENRTESHYPPPLELGELAMIEYEINQEAARG